MKFSHSGDDCLSSLLISMSTECRVFFSQFCKRFTKFTLGSFCLRLDSKLDNWFWEFHWFQNYRMLLVTDCITCCSEFKSDSGCDITWIYFIKLFTFVGMHLKDTSNTLFFILCSIQYIRTWVHCTRVNSEVCQFTYEWVCHNLECKCWERLFIWRMSYNLITILIHTIDWRDICWCRHVLKDCIKKFLYTFVSVSWTTANRNCCTLACCFSECFLHIFNRWFFTFQILHHQIIIKIADLLYHFCMVKFCIICHIFRDICNRNVISLIIVVDVSFHFHQVNDSLEVIFFTDW